MRTASLIAIALLLASSGCATRWTVFGHSMGGPSPVDRPSGNGNGSPQSAGPIQESPHAASAPHSGLPNIKAVKVTFTPAAREKIATEPQFTEDGLRAAIEAELRAQKLLDDSESGSGDIVEVVIDDFATRAPSNVVLFGYVLSTGTLKGKLELRAPDGTALHNSRIQARSSLTKPAGGQGNSFEPLYKGFADLTARNLTGAPEPVAVNH